MLTNSAYQVRHGANQDRKPAHTQAMPFKPLEPKALGLDYLLRNASAGPERQFSAGIGRSNMGNEHTWRDAAIVERYLKYRERFPAEDRFLDSMSSSLSQASMLDIGVGGGRTTEKFAPRVREYIGVDYSLPMIEACRKAFAAHPEWKFARCDARDFSVFPDARFDFVLFSYSGIDYVTHEDRLLVLQEIRRVCRPGGYVLFSSHNLNTAMDTVFGWQRSGGAMRLPIDAASFVLRYAVNVGFLLGRRQEYARLNDGVYRFRLRTYYIRPAAQVKQLESAGFTDVRVFGANGEQVPPTTFDDISTGAQPYYFCRG